MRTVTVTRSIDAPPEGVFDLLADHARYGRFRGIRRAELLRDGEPPPNGVGALRRVIVGPLRFDEEVTAFERPLRLDYLIFEINAPFEHEGGTIRLTKENGGTRAEWSTTFGVPTPLVGGVQERLWALALRRGLGRVLEDVERMLADERAA
jgi:uncharacterized protein YndB with AHSA1/START domain